MLIIRKINNIKQENKIKKIVFFFYFHSLCRILFLSLKNVEGRSFVCIENSRKKLIKNVSFWKMILINILLKFENSFHFEICSKRLWCLNPTLYLQLLELIHCYLLNAVNLTGLGSFSTFLHFELAEAFIYHKDLKQKLCFFSNFWKF